VDLPTTRAFNAIRRLINNTRVDLAKLSALVLPNLPRKTTVDISGLAASTTAPFLASWNAPVTGNYRVMIQPVIADARLGTIFATVDPTTKAATSVSISVRNTTAQPLAAGSLDVVIHPD
jgi:hypothetical protein